LLTGATPPSAQAIFVKPDALVLPRKINAAISPAVESAILVAMSPRPGDRSPTVEVWRRLLQNQATLRPAPSPWKSFWHENGWLIALGIVLSALTLYLSFAAR
jgi:hypothetical protein